MYQIGVDIGGTNIKIGLVDEALEIVARSSIPFPQADGEIVADKLAEAIRALRENEQILKKPSIAETLDWVAALEALGAEALTPEAMRQTLGFVLKNNEDVEEALHDEALGLS